MLCPGVVVPMSGFFVWMPPRMGILLWEFYIDDMLRYARKALAYSAGLDQAKFERDDQKYDAILRNLELIGEAGYWCREKTQRSLSSSREKLSPPVEIPARSPIRNR